MYIIEGGERKKNKNINNGDAGTISSCATPNQVTFTQLTACMGEKDKRVTGKQATLGYGHKANYTECKYSNNLCLHF